MFHYDINDSFSDFSSKKQAFCEILPRRMINNYYQNMTERCRIDDGHFLAVLGPTGENNEKHKTQPSCSGAI